MSTLQQLIWQAQSRIAESRSTLAAQQAMNWPAHVRQAADKIARETWSLKRHAVVDLIANKMEYTIPQRPFQLLSINAKNKSGIPYKLSAIDSASADNKFFGWRAGANSASVPLGWTGTPSWFIPEGRTSYFVLPVPNYSAEDGLYVTGYYGVGDWWGLPDAQPFGDGYEEPILHGAIAERCLEMIAFDDSGKYEKLLGLYQPKFQQFIEDRYGEALIETESDGQMIPPIGPRFGDFGGGWWGYIG